MADVFVFGEGPTDKVVFNFLANEFFNGRIPRPFIPVGGKDKFPDVIKVNVESKVIAGEDVKILIFRDLDKGESPKGVVNSFLHIVWSLFSKWNLKPAFRSHPLYSNIYISDQPSSGTKPGLHLVLHLADTGGFSLPEGLPNQTTDGYVLAAGLENSVLNRFAIEGKVGSTVGTLQTLITDTIPNEILKTGIPFEEDKDFLASYLCTTRFYVVKRTDHQATLVKIILGRALKYEPTRFGQIFTTWQEAIKEAIR